MRKRTPVMEQILGTMNLLVTLRTWERRREHGLVKASRVIVSGLDRERQGEGRSTSIAVSPAAAGDPGGLQVRRH
jgi:hypothetical protein